MSTIGEMNEIPFVDLKTQYQQIKPQIDYALGQVLEHGFFILGEEVTRFEIEFSAYIGTAHAVGTGNGTDAIELALRACGIGAGDEVITAANTSVATVAAIERAGARAVLADVTAARFTIDPERVFAAITPKTRAIIPVHLYGCPADMPSILNIARDKDLFVIEDCAQAHGAMLAGKRAGTWGDAAAFSFYPTKNLGAYGDGGAVVTSDPGLAEKVRFLRQYGWEQRYISKYKGVNSRLDDMQAAILNVKLPYLDDWNARRQYLAGIYDTNLAPSSVILPSVPKNALHVYHQYVIRCQNRDEMRQRLQSAKIQAQIHYPVPIHLQPAYKDLGYRSGDFPVTEKLAGEILSLPIYAELSGEAVLRVCQSINDILD